MYAYGTDGRQRIRSASYVLTSVMQRFSTNQGTNLAAILTYYAVFALFPSLVALVSIMKLSGVGDTLVPEFASMIQQAVPDAGTAEMLVDLIEGFFSASGAGIGLVIGGTHTEEATAIRSAYPQTFFLIPGYGAQGGKAADIAQYMNNSHGGVVNSSRGILLAYKKQPGVAFDEAAYNECVRMKEDIQGECNKL